MTTLDKQNAILAPPILGSSILEGLSQFSDGAWEWQAESNALRCSQNLVRHLGFAPDGLLTSVPLDEVFKRLHPDDYNSVEIYVRDFKTSKEECFQTEFRLRDASGQYLWLYTRGHASRDESGALLRVMGTITDTTPFHELQEQLTYAIAEREEVSQAKSHFIATLNHELRAPLSGIVGMANMLTDTSLDPKQNRFVKNIIASAEMLLTLVNDILDVSKIHAGKLQIETIPFDVYEIIEQAIQLTMPAATNKKLDIHTKITPGLPHTLVGDPVRIQQILVNLLSNAVKFTHQGSVTLSLGFEPYKGKMHRFHFKIIDTGIGMSEEILEKLFRDFNQGGATITRTYGGTGLGLSICKKLVTLMGGEIGVESTPDQGSTFWFYLPLEIGEAEAAALQPLPTAGGRTGKLRILVVEDNPINQEVLVSLLEKIGDQVEVADNGQEGLDKFQSGQYDLILMDVNMPVMDGVAATQAIRQLANGKNIPIIAVTANSLAAERQNCLDVGMTDVITKPVDKKKLETLLSHYRPYAAGANAPSFSQMSSSSAQPTQQPQTSVLTEKTATTETPSLNYAQDSQTKENMAFEKPEEVSLLDRQHIDGLLEDISVERFLKLLDVYQKDAIRLLRMLTPQDVAQGKEVAHTLAGMSENLGGKGVGQAARKLMNAFKEGTSGVADMIMDVEDKLMGTLKEFNALAEQIKKRGG